MTALKVFERVLAADSDILEIQDKIDRRRALATSTTTRPLSQNSGSSGGSSDASMRLLDFMGNVEELEKKLNDRKVMKENDLACCVYLLEMLPADLAGVMSRRYLECKSQKTCAEELGYSITTIRRMQREAEGICSRITLTWWDGNHIPVTVIPDSLADILQAPKKMVTDDR